ncbi:hypothetical protein HMPREF9997_01451 [Corynebacterium durum F0235]|uniref:Uncharacterized protein n=1 Tax=Corynebacterium durum F0235 TaxID=1035195 RepID=L1MH33_9CORY|nr:hypothetical protein HMPREF9997_01451 [Corynebacterium durum F0235]
MFPGLTAYKLYITRILIDHQNLLHSPATRCASPQAFVNPQ